MYCFHAEDTAHSEEHLSQVHEDLSLIPRSKQKNRKKVKALLYVIEVTLLGWQWHVDLLSLLGSQTTLLGDFQGNRRLSKQKVYGTKGTAPVVAV